MTPTTTTEWQAYLAKLGTNARRQQTIMRREQDAGQFDMSVRQTRRMYLSVESAQRATGKLERARRDFETWRHYTEGRESRYVVA